MNLADFVTAAEEARQAINAWVEEETEGRIVDLIPEGVITDLTRLVLVNAIWFKANWAEQFDPALTVDGTFTTLGGAEVTVPLMHGGGRLPYTSGDGYQAVRLPYAGDAASMLIVLPEAGGFEDFAARLDPATLEAIRQEESTHQVALTMPRFEFRSEFALKPALEELGMVAAFTEPSLPGGADLTGMTPRRELFVHEVVHQAFITVDEQGTEAAAATAVIIGLESAPPPATVTIDRPFLFLIEHESTGEILFIGQVTDPS
jgi:serpin B